MSLPPLISVIMPVFNGGQFLKESITSILDQTYSNLEFLIINDGSTDDSEDIILSFTDSRIRYFRNSQNSGIVKTLNRAIELSKGNYIARMDSDDVAFPARLEKQLQFLIHNPAVVLCGCQAQQIDRNGNVNVLLTCPIHLEEIRVKHLFNSAFIHPATFFKAEILRLYKYKEDYENAEDYFLFAQLVNKYQVANLPEVLLSYRVHQNNITVTNHQKMAESRKKVHYFQLQQLLGYLPDDKLIMMLESLSVEQYQFNVKYYGTFFHKLLTANQSSNHYNRIILNTYLTEIWFRILMLKSGRKILSNYFSSPMYRWSTLTPKRLRRMIKCAIRGY